MYVNIFDWRNGNYRLGVGNIQDENVLSYYNWKQKPPMNLGLIQMAQSQDEGAKDETTWVHKWYIN